MSNSAGTKNTTGNTALDQRTIILAYMILFAGQAFISTNVIFGKLAADIAPFTLAFLRWGITALILITLSRKHLAKMVILFRNQWKLLFVLGFAGMFICGGIVYLALHSTSATNGILIYTTPPIFILLMERIWKGRAIKPREIAGVILAISGVVIIISRGQWVNIVNLTFTPGDLLFLLASMSWAIYSVLLKNEELAEMGTFPLFGLIAACGAIILLPFSAAEALSGMALPHLASHWLIIAGIVFLSSLIAFSSIQYGIKILGPSIAGIFMYLLPPFGITFAWAFLGEILHNFHLAGIVTILGGVILATFPNQLLAKVRSKTS